jgi:hypothetical protein
MVEWMMGLRELLREHRAAIARRWYEDVLGTYPEEAGVAFTRERDRFANPVGHQLREATQKAVDALVEGLDAETTAHQLDELIRIRAVQRFSPSHALAFIFRLKGIVRAELGPPGEHPATAAEWDELDRRIDRLALSAFDAYTQCREQVCELRVNEVKRQVAWVLDKLQGRMPGSDAVSTASRGQRSGAEMDDEDTR